jgi:predicted acyl esterase
MSGTATAALLVVRDVMIRARDGIGLATDIYRPGKIPR